MITSLASRYTCHDGRLPVIITHHNNICPKQEDVMVFTFGYVGISLYPTVYMHWLLLRGLY